MKKHILYLFVFTLSLYQLQAQTIPATYDLGSGNYTLTEWAAAEPAGTYPSNMIFHLGNLQDASLSTFIASTDYTGAYNASSGTRIKGLGTSGFSFLNTGTSGFLGQAVLALNASNRQDITIDFTAGLVTQGDGSPTPRDYRIRLQYKIGLAGAWTDVSPVTEYASAGQISGHSQSYSGIVLPSACNHQPLVQVRWIYYQQAANNGGSRPEIRIDDITISSSVYSGPPLIPVSLSADLTTGNESSSTSITITATAASPVTSNETVDLFVSGSQITASDYILSSSQITILNGQTTGTATFTIQNDNLNEGIENALIAISSVSPGLVMSNPFSVSISIIDDDESIHLIALNTPSTTTTFDELEITGTTNTTVPRGIYFFEQNTNANIYYRSDNGSSTTGDTYSYGSTSSSERALGSLSTGTLGPCHIGARLLNNTGTLVNALEITFTGEQWRKGGTTAGDKLMFELSTDATSLNTGTWTPFSTLNFAAIHEDGTSGALDGNLPANRLLISDEITGFGNINTGASVWIRWKDIDVTGSDDGMAIDDLIITPKFIACAAPLVQATVLQTSNITGTSVDLNWTNGSGTNRLVIGRLGSAVSDNPVNGTNYTANNNFGTTGTELGSGYVLYNGTGNSVSVTGLQPGQDYYFSVMEYNCNPGEYLITTPPTAMISTPTIPSLFASVTTLPIFNSQVGLATLPDSFQVSGLYLTNDVFLSAPTPFEISLSYGSGFATSLQLTPSSGTLSPVWIFVRYNPISAGMHSGNINIISTGATPLDVAISGNATIAGSLPATFSLCSGNYQFTNWASTSIAGTYPTNMIFHKFNAQDPTLGSQDTANYSLAYNLTSGTRITGLGANGISFLNTSTPGNLGAAVVGLDASGRQNITVNFTAGLITQTDNNRVYNLRLQYRIANGAWTDVPGPVEYSSLGKSPGHDSTFTGIVLPASCDNQPNLYLRWFYFRDGTGSGTRPSIRLDDITISSTSTNPALSDMQPVLMSEAAIIPSSTTGVINTNTDGIQVWSFTINDGGALGDADAFDTYIQSITITQGASNTIPNFVTAVGFAALFDGNIKIADGTINANSISFSSLNLVIPDDGSITYDLRLSLATTGNLTDGTNFQFQILNTNIISGAGCNGSQLAPFSITSDGTLNMIDVQATRLVFSYVPLTVTENQNFSIILLAKDDNNNTDKSPRSITVSTGIPSSGTLSSISGLGPKPMTNGIVSWNDLQYDVVETFQLVADDGNLLQNDTLINCIPACSTPTVPSSVFGFNFITTQSATVSWNSGNGSERIVIVRQGSAVIDYPTNGISYSFASAFGTAGTELGSGYVVYKGTDAFVNITNLQPNTTYHVAVFDFNCSPELYLLSPLTGSFTTVDDSNVENWNTNAQWTFYPNPSVDGLVYFSSPVSVTVYDATGRTVLKTSMTGHINTIGWRSGVYVLQLESGKSYKLIVP